MAKNSSLYNKLYRRIQNLEKCYLPKYNVEGRYTNKEQDDIRAYSLLVHAELESYFESISKSKVEYAFGKWKLNHRYNTQILLSLSCFVEQSQKVKLEKSLEKKLGKIVGIFNLTIKNNNGIKEDNVKELFLPLGIDESLMDRTWLNTLSSFGSKRGEIAHTGASSVNVVLDPKDIKETIQKILLELKNLDTVVNNLK